MIKDDLFSFPFIQKSVFTGSYHGMQYRVGKDNDQLTAWVFPGPYAFAYTPEEEKQSRSFAFSPEGYQQAIEWLEEMAQSRDWEAR